MKESKLLRFFSQKKKKKDFFAEFSSEFMQILKDIILLYRNFFHWLVSKIIINIVAFVIWLVLALPFVVLWVFVALIDPIPWWDFIVYQVRGFDPLPEVLTYASMFIFPFVIVTFLMIWAFIAFVIWNAYSNVLFVPLYEWYIKWEKLDIYKHFRVKFVRIWYFVKIALWQLSIIALPILIVWMIILILTTLFIWEKMSFEAFSLTVLPLIIILIFILSYVIFRVLFSIILFAHSSSKNLVKHSAWYFIKKSFKLTSWVWKYVKFLFVLCTIYIFMYPFTILTNTIANDRERLSQTIEYRALSFENTELLKNSRLYEVAREYEYLSDGQLFANYRWAQLLALAFSIISFLLFSWFYTMVFVSFYNRILK